MYHQPFAETAPAGPHSRFIPRPRLPQATSAVALFADIVGYTEHCQSLDPEEVYLLLCEFYRHAGRATAAHEADFVDHFGDEVLAVWKDDAPIDRDELGFMNAIDPNNLARDSREKPASTFSHPALGRQALRALQCGFTLLAEIGQWNAWREKNDLARIKVGVGIHAGPVMLGRPLGGYGGGASVFGDTVNIASRLERQTRSIGADIVISDRLFRLIRATAPHATLLDRFAGTLSVTLSGRSEPIDIRHAAVLAQDMPASLSRK